MFTYRYQFVYCYTFASYFLRTSYVSRNFEFVKRNNAATLNTDHVLCFIHTQKQQCCCTRTTALIICKHYNINYLYYWTTVKHLYFTMYFVDTTRSNNVICMWKTLSCSCGMLKFVRLNCNVTSLFITCCRRTKVIDYTHCFKLRIPVNAQLESKYCFQFCWILTTLASMFVVCRNRAHTRFHKDRIQRM